MTEYNASEHNIPECNMSELAQQLVAWGYKSLFGATPDQALINSLISTKGIKQSLTDIACGQQSNWEERFLAAEFLFQYVDMTFSQNCDKSLLGESYFQAMRHNYSGNGIDWGMEKAPNELGSLGYAAIGLGKEGGSAFRQGLDNDEILIVYFNWQIPSHFRPPYRVKDFSALILSKIYNLVINLDGEPEVRDEAIKQLKQQLES